MIEISSLVTIQLERCIPDTLEKWTRRLLRKCLPSVSAACEQLCPVVLEARGAIAYGPNVPAGYERLAIFATPQGSMSAAFNSWCQLDACEAPITFPAMISSEVVNAVAEANASYALTLLTHRLQGGGLAALDAPRWPQSRTSTRPPAIVVLAAK